MGWGANRLAWIAGALAALPLEAAAGAWVAPEGGQQIHTEAVGERDDTLYLESQYYFEAPLSERLAFVARPWLESSAGLAEGWRGEIEAGLKHAILRNDRGALALQAAALWRSDPGSDCGEGGAELRALGGVSFAQGRAFLNAEAGQRVQEGGCPAQRIDLASGFRFTPAWLGMAEAFLHDDPAGDATVKAQLSLVRFDSAGRGVQVGVRMRVDGEAPEPALVLAFWNGG